MSAKRLLAAAWRVNRVFPVVIALLLLVNLAGFLILTRVYAPHNEALERELIQKEGLARQARLQGTVVLLPQEAYRQGEEGLNALNEAIPDRTEFTALISEIFSLAKGAGLGIAKVGYKPKSLPERGLLEYTLDFGVVGDYVQIKRFIFSLEQSPRIIIIEKIDMSRVKETDKESVGLGIRLTTYFKSDIL